MLGLLDGATQLKDNGGTRPGATVARRGGAKPSYGEERFLGELEFIMR
jgi:hypothetical protein